MNFREEKNLKKTHHLSWECDLHTSAPEYAERFSGRTGDFLLRRQTELLLEFAGDIKGKRVLDAGGGHGQNAAALMESGAEYTVCASGEGCFDSLNKVLRGRSAQASAVKFSRGGLFPLPFPDRHFDAVVSFRILSHVPDWRLFLGELCRVSRGKVIIDYAPETGCILKKVFIFLKGSTEPAARAFTTQRPEEVEKAAAGFGFEPAGSEREFILPMVFHRLSGGGLFFPVEKAAARLGLTSFFGGPVVASFKRRGGF